MMVHYFMHKSATIRDMQLIAPVTAPVRAMDKPSHSVYTKD